jgi:hypothetical protein
MRRYCLFSSLQIESVTLRFLLSLQYQDLQNKDVTKFQCTQLSKKYYCEIQRNLYPNPSSLVLQKTS